MLNTSDLGYVLGYSFFLISSLFLAPDNELEGLPLDLVSTLGLYESID